MIAAALDAFEQIFTPPFRAVLWKSLGLTLLILVGASLGADRFVVATAHLASGWLAVLVHLAAGLGLVVGLLFLIGPVSFIVASCFFDELAEHVEDAVAPARGRALAITPALWIGLKFAAVSALVNVVALALLLVPGVNAIAFFGANAYLFGRGFFELAALRYRPLPDVRRLRQRHALRITVAGCCVAAMASIPLVNLLTPLFATALLVRVAQPIVANTPVQALR